MTRSRSILQLNVLTAIKTVIGLGILLFVPMIFNDKLSKMVANTTLNSTLINLATVILALLLYIGYLRLWNREQTFSELSLRRAWVHVLFGSMIGFGLFSCVIAVIAVFAHYEVIQIHSWTVIFPGIISALSTGVSEELAFRGIFFRLVEERLGTVSALILSGMLFGFMHLGNPGATIESSLAITIEAGFMLALAYVLARNLWFPIFIHTFWNYSEGSFYGAEVSGTLPDFVFIQSQISGNPLITGGYFGPEAGIPAIVLGTLLAIIFGILAKQKGLWIAKPQPL